MKISASILAADQKNIINNLNEKEDLLSNAEAELRLQAVKIDDMNKSSSVNEKVDVLKNCNK